VETTYIKNVSVYISTEKCCFVELLADDTRDAC